MTARLAIGVDSSTDAVVKWYDADSSDPQVNMQFDASNDHFKLNKLISGSETEVMRVDEDGKVHFYKNVAFEGGSTTVNSTTMSLEDQQLEIGIANSMNVASVTKYSTGSAYNYKFTVSSARANHTVGESWAYTGSASTTVWTSSEAHGLSVGDIIQLASGSGSVTNISQATNYYVKTVPSTTTLTLSTSNTESTISAITVTAGGSGYTSAPTVAISADAGSSATATATISGGAVTAISVTGAGSGYNNGATVTISGGGGSGATATVTLVDVPGSAIAGGSDESVTSWTMDMMTTFSSGSYVYLQNARDSAGDYLSAFQAALDVIDSTATTFTVQTSSDNTLDLTTYPVVSSKLMDLTDNTGMFILANNSGTLVEAKVAYDNSSDKSLIVENSAGKIKIGSESVNQNIEIGKGGTRSVLVGESNTATTEVELNAITVDVNAGSGKLSLDGSGGIDIGTTANVAVDLNSSSLTIDSTGSTAITAGSTLGITATSGNTTFNCTGRTLDIDAATLDMDLTAASSINTTGANLDITTTTGGDININSVADLDLDGATVNVNSSGATAVTAGSTLGITATSGTTTINCAGQTLDVDATTVNIASSAATVVAAGSTLGITATSGTTTFDCTGQTLDLNAATLDMDLTSNSSINATSANLDITTTTSGDININSVADLDLDGATVTVNSSGATAITAGSTLGITATSGTTTFNCAGQTLNVDAAALQMDSTDTTNLTMTANNAADRTLTIAATNSHVTGEGLLDINAEGALTIDSSAGAISIGSDNINQAINIGTDGTRTITIGKNASDTTMKLNGSITATGEIGSTSDVRLKKDIVDLSGALDKVNKLHGVTFKWKADPKERDVIGFIAQEVEEVVPELIREDDRGYLTVNYLGSTALLVEAVKEQQKMIEQLQYEVANLKAMANK